MSYLVTSYLAQHLATAGALIGKFKFKMHNKNQPSEISISKFKCKKWTIKSINNKVCFPCRLHLWLKIKQQQILPATQLSPFLFLFFYFFFSRTKTVGFELFWVIFLVQSGHKKHNINTKIIGMNLPGVLSGAEVFISSPFLLCCSLLVTHLTRSVVVLYL